MENPNLLAMAEQLRRIQSQCNAYDLPLALTNNAWGDLGRAITHILTEHYVTKGHALYIARRMAKRVVTEVYDNGENIAYNMDLLAKGEIEVLPLWRSRAT